MLRLIDENGEQLGVMETRRAISIARERELDVVVISESVSPPVAKIVDLNKYHYKEQQRKKAQAKNARASRTELKEMQFRPTIGDHDFVVKANKIKKFLDKGDQVKIVIRFKGRERHIYKESGLELFDKLSKSLETEYVTEPKFVGSSIIAILK
jgi:translation initiation factor IF-3|tara:strand:- start:6221 stop:6682 length:462 start_codon:yes stop_codon:yes gene_type:complete